MTDFVGLARRLYAEAMDSCRLNVETRVACEMLLQVSFFLTLQKGSRLLKSHKNGLADLTLMFLWCGNEKTKAVVESIRRVHLC